MYKASSNAQLQFDIMKRYGSDFAVLFCALHVVQSLGFTEAHYESGKFQ